MDKPGIKKNGKAQRHQARIWYSRGGGCQTGDLNTHGLALTSICDSAKCSLFSFSKSAACCAGAASFPYI
jgi:hypothetical protein